ncbi:hypothetical protein ACFL47_07725 [Candidatus Latescibacterota bacterium]
MTSRFKKTSTTRWVLSGTFVFIICLSAAYVAFAQGRKTTMKYKEILHHTQINEIEAGDVPGHTLYSGENRGLAILDKGELATYKGWWLWDGIEINGKGTGSGHGCGVTTFEDGSTIVTQFKGSDTDEQRSGNFVNREKGAITITGGTGRFKGIKGSGNYTAKRIEVGGELYVETTLNYTLP